MFSVVISGAICGMNCFLTRVEVDLSTGLPVFDMVGFLSGEVRESKDRVRVALKNSEILFPVGRITINISPADTKKEGSAFDLPIAIGILIADGMIKPEKTEKTLVIGELGLSGEVRFVKGILPIVLEAKAAGIKRCILPLSNLAEGNLVGGVEIIGVESLKETIEYLNGKDIKRDRHEELPQENNDVIKIDIPDFSDITGQESVRRAAEIAAAGFHNLLIIGPPGSGKTMAAKRISTILPPLTKEESLEVSKIYSIAGLMKDRPKLMVERPFQSPHSTISKQALAGGGKTPRPGVLSLAHRGVLYLDETPDFGRAVLDVMRAPLEERQINIARSIGAFTFPANFMLVCSMNPCPCGYYPDRKRCKCSMADVSKYLGKISGPILDRIDLCVQAPPVDIKELSSSMFDAEGKKNESSADIRKRVMLARNLQEQRFKGTGFNFNADLVAGNIKKYCELGAEERDFVEQVFSGLSISARAYHRILKVARTIADLDGSEEIKKKHIGEAVCYRSGEIVKS